MVLFFFFFPGAFDFWGARLRRGVRRPVGVDQSEAVGPPVVPNRGGTGDARMVQ